MSVAAVLAAAAALWFLARPLPDIEQQRRHFAELQRQVRLAGAGKAARQADRGRVMRLEAQARTSQGAQREQFGSEATALQARLGWGDSVAVRSAVLATPLVRVERTTTLDGFPDAGPDRGTGCQACHVGIATPGLEKYPAPFRTHPKFANYVGAASPHPPSRVGCASCHMGDEYASTFEAAGHSRPPRRPAAPAVSRAWNEPSKPGAMLPAAHTEAGCATCHLGERYQPGATALNEALATLERGGCYACHQIPGMQHTAKRGPDLRRIRGKLTPEWVTLWLADPRAMKPATWMPAFWSGRDALGTPQRAVIDAVVAYLFDASEPASGRVVAVGSGNAARGQALVESVGCLGCHVVGATPRETVGVRRTFGQPLQALAGKTTDEWLFEWVRNPSSHSPGTRMPNLRLSDAQARDIGAYLGTLGSPEPPATNRAPEQDDAAYIGVLQTYGAGASVEPSLRGAALRVAAGRAVIEALGCFNCHEIRGFENRSTTVPIRGRQYWDEAALLTLFPHSAGTPAPQASDVATHGPAPGLKVHPGPDFRFAPLELDRLSLALTAVAGRDTDRRALSTPWHLAKVTGRTLMQERNCVGCHPIEDTGGDFVKLVAEPTLGPPLLTPEGARVQPAWLREFLREPTTIRPWLSVRMPTFGLGAEDVDVVGNYLRAIAPENPKPAAASAGVTPDTSKALFELLKCQQCHVLGSIPKDQPTSNLAPDLRMARERLQPDWILSWLKNPGAILPGTRMPTFWPDYPKSFYEPLDKDGQKQVRAIRDHLLNLR